MTSERASGARALVVDDDEQVLRAHARVLTMAGYQVEVAADAAVALRAVERTSFDFILCDVDMPGMSGLTLLERVRVIDLDVPVVLITGKPSMDTAIRAMEHGALRYLLKPVSVDALVKVAGDAVRLHRIAKAKRHALELVGDGARFSGDEAALEGAFDRCLQTLHIAYQPIVSWSKMSVFAYEALLRSREPSLPHPGAVLDAAERLGRVHELGRIIRARAIEPLGLLPDDVAIFINIHPSDLLDEQLFAADGPLAAVAGRIVLEITERASLQGIDSVLSRVGALRELGFRIAIDDLGAGYAGLTSFALLEPDIVKLDIALVRDIDQQPTKQTLVRTMVSMCKELGMVVTAEGMETVEERDELVKAGCDLMQGYLFARPGDAFPVPLGLQRP